MVLEGMEEVGQVVVVDMVEEVVDMVEEGVEEVGVEIVHLLPTRRPFLQEQQEQEQGQGMGFWEDGEGSWEGWGWGI